MRSASRRSVLKAGSPVIVPVLLGLFAALVVTRFTGAGSKTVIPSQASAKITIALRNKARPIL